MATRSASGRAGGATATKDVPGNQTPNTPEINESEIARLKVDQLRDRLRRRGITGTADMRKDELVDALITALRDGRKTTPSRTGSGSAGRATAAARGSSGSRAVRSDSPQAAELAEVERRAAELENVTPQAAEVEEVERRAAELEAAVSGSTALPAPPADAAPDTPALPPAPADADATAEGHTPTPPGGTDEADRPGKAHVPQPRGATGPEAAQAVRTADGAAGSGPELTMETADRVLTSMVPAELDPVDEVVTPEGTILTAGAGSADAAVATPPLPTTERRERTPSSAR
ncbi:hypothetical protein NCC78_03740 [Micromonospora phytophila]|uniref:hypothetical protein n=1 Tax=Micromonospora phytophila TaxID=709888 RepID=UPI00202EE7D3|nr:hypothetical protein [Micromonospora phytophila]MCM0673819.1 hypothetical protein [Micromonospora phytophila]